MKMGEAIAILNHFCAEPVTQLGTQKHCMLKTNHIHSFD